MNIHITIKNLEVPSVGLLESSIQKKVGGLAKFMKGFESHTNEIPGSRGLFDAFVEVKRTTNHHRKGMVYSTEIKLYVPGKTLFAKAQGDDVMKTVLEAREEMEAEIRKYKTKIVERPRRQNRRAVGLE